MQRGFRAEEAAPTQDAANAGGGAAAAGRWRARTGQPRTGGNALLYLDHKITKVAVWEPVTLQTAGNASAAMASFSQIMAQRSAAVPGTVWMVVAFALVVALSFCLFWRSSTVREAEPQPARQPQEEGRSQAAGQHMEAERQQLAEVPQIATPSSPRGAVVPGGDGGATECCLMIPILPDGPGPMQVCDRHGNTILKALPRWDPAGDSPEFCLPWYEVLSKSGDTLAHCAATRQGRCPEFEFYRPQFEPFGKLAAVGASDDGEAAGHREAGQAEEPEHYKLNTASGLNYKVSGRLRERRLCFTDQDGTCIAMTEPVSPGAYLLRAASLKDAGFILCTLLSIEYLSTATAVAH